MFWVRSGLMHSKRLFVLENLRTLMSLLTMTLCCLPASADHTRHFFPKVDYATPFGPGVIAVGDLNLDGFPDLVTSGNGSSLAVLLGNGDGTFQHYTTYTT